MTRLPPSRVRVWLLTEGLIDTDEHVRDSNLLLAAFTTAIPGLNLKLGNMTTLPSDLDHLAQADVLLTANSGLSLVAASLARGVMTFSHTLLHELQICNVMGLLRVAHSPPGLRPEPPR